jgi:hypothetical protein
MTMQSSPQTTQQPDGPDVADQGEPLSEVRAAIAARMLAKKIAAASPRPPAGRRAQEVDAEPVGPAIRVKGTTLGGPHYPRQSSR